MRIKVNLKRLGKRKPQVEIREYDIAGTPSTVRELILAVTEAGVAEYNQRAAMTERESREVRGTLAAGGERSETTLPGLLTWLSREEIQEQAQAGKVSFGVNYGGRAADLAKAQENALQSFEDGIYRIFLDDRALEELEEPILITEATIFTFVRLTMLAGRMW